MLEVEPPGLGSQLGGNNIFATLARHGDLFRAWLPFGGFLLTRGVLTARERELLTLRTGFNCGSSYEWGQHVAIAEAVGVERAEVGCAWPRARTPRGWTPADAVLLARRRRAAHARDRRSRRTRGRP